VVLRKSEPAGMTHGSGCPRSPLSVAPHAGALCTPGQTQALTKLWLKQSSTAPAQLLLYVSPCFLLRPALKDRRGAGAARSHGGTPHPGSEQDLCLNLYATE